MTGKETIFIWQNRHWTDFSWKSDELLPVLGRARRIQGAVLARAKSLGLPLTREAQTEILIEEAVKTSAIEGKILDKASVRSSVARHLGLSRAGLPKAPRDVDGLVEILLDATRNYGKPLTAKRLQGWQAGLFPTGYSGSTKIDVGRWRTGGIRVISGHVDRQKIHYQAPPATRLEGEMKHFLQWWKKSLGKAEGLLRAAIAHFWFVTVHPFEDGNGRIARLLTDMALAQDEEMPVRFYSLSSQIMKERKAYYGILEKSQKGGLDITDWLNWFLGCTIRSIESSTGLIAKVLAKASFWHRHTQTSMNERQRKVVNRILDAGQGQFQGGLTTRKYVSLTKTSRATAFREMADLVKKDVLVQDSQSKGRNVRYDLIWDK